jgi:hypothetical protein
VQSDEASATRINCIQYVVICKLEVTVLAMLMGKLKTFISLEISCHVILTPDSVLDKADSLLRQFVVFLSRPKRMNKLYLKVS